MEGLDFQAMLCLLLFILQLYTRYFREMQPVFHMEAREIPYTYPF